MRTVAPRLAVGSIAAALLLSGCGGSPEPSPLPKPTESTSPSASPTPVPPSVPQIAKEQTKSGAEAFARHYVDLINYAQSTGDLKGLRAVELKTCKSCAQAASYLSDLYSSGGSIRGGDFRVQSAAAVRSTNRKWLVELGVQFGPQTVDHPSPKPDEHPKGGRLPLNVQLVWRANDWKVLEWTRGA